MFSSLTAPFFRAPSHRHLLNPFYILATQGSIARCSHTRASTYLFIYIYMMLLYTYVISHKGLLIHIQSYILLIVYVQILPSSHTGLYQLANIFEFDKVNIHQCQTLWARRPVRPATAPLNIGPAVAFPVVPPHIDNTRPPARATSHP